ncbi:interferon alpha-inducible protein 27-like protein 2 [Sphaeramia orbicularis]|uniref:interferon alpha-inducible protein 27-like protein 2 n=1 Tax=Sphaeramia orbicularis TaxID=375764 RepID=UPI00117D3C44|nr:interferon alpha-inducible protein 27-like protein 2 [Sphaeramia orbicularis]
MEGLFVVIGIAAGAVFSVVSVPAVLGFIGFKSIGIAAGTLAAKMMSWIAVLNGGGVPAGSLVALLQSIAMGGLSMAAKVILAGAGGAVGWLLLTIFR